MQAINKLVGLEQVMKAFKEEFYSNLNKHRDTAYTLEESNCVQETIDNASIGQLYTFSYFPANRLKSLKIHNADKEGTIYLSFCGVYGGMDLDGNIHT